MKIKNNLRLRFVVSFVFYALLITSIFAVIVVALELKLAHEFFQRRIVSELEYYAERYKSDPTSPLPNAEDIMTFLGTDKMPQYIRDIVSHLPDGYYNRDVDRDEVKKAQKRGNRNFKYLKGEDDLLFGVKTLPDNKKIYFFVNLNFWHEKQHHLRLHYSMAFFFVGIFGIIFGLRTAKQVISPLNKLIDLINNARPDHLPTGFSRLFRNDEFGDLAHAFDSSLQRVKKFMEREHQFTRDASHELRTPVTVVKGAVKLLQMTPIYENEEMIKKLVDRIDRSSADMQNTIESLLWLAREQSSDKASHPCNVEKIVQNAVEQNRHLVSSKPVEIFTNVIELPHVTAPFGALDIAVSNLIRNACQYTSKGKIDITLKSDRIEIADTGIGIEKDNFGNITQSSVTGKAGSGFGFGLDIVNKLCARFGWQLEIDGTPGKGTTSSLIFGQKQNPSY